MKRPRRPSRTAWVTALVSLALITLAAWLFELQPGSFRWRDPGQQRWWLAGLSVAIYGAFCSGLAWRRSRRSTSFGAGGDDAVLVIHSSQTGHAEQLALQTAQALSAANVPVRVVALHDLTIAALVDARRALFVASTTGEGDPPDGALHFIRAVMADAPQLDLEYGLLALGDRQYQQFCGWGRRLDEWLRQQGATALFDRIEVDDADPSALDLWRSRLGVMAGHDLDAWKQPDYAGWKLVERRRLNPGSAGGPCFHIALEPPDKKAQWVAGDVLAIALPGDPPGGPPILRDYSIASLPSDGAVHLLIRQTRRPDGSLGIGSGWLTATAEIGDTVGAQLRSNNSFHAPDDARPMILIGNGTGIAGLRALLKSRAADGYAENWLVFGERQAEHDFLYRDELLAWQSQGMLKRLDLAFSRDSDRRYYVQDCLREQAAELAAWIARGAAIYVCGSAQGMAAGVDAALQAALGSRAVDELRESGRYRRDVY